MAPQVMRMEDMREAIRSGVLVRISEGCGIHVNTLRRIRDGVLDPRYTTYIKISDYLMAHSLMPSKVEGA